MNNKPDIITEAKENSPYWQRVIYDEALANEYIYLVSTKPTEPSSMITTGNSPNSLVFMPLPFETFQVPGPSPR